MYESADDVLLEADDKMEKAIAHLQQGLSGLRTGKASPSLVDHISVDCYGAQTRLNQMAIISTPEPRLIVIKAYDPSSLPAIEKAILASELGLTPSNDGKVIRLNLPPLNEERRRDLVRMVNHRLEECRVAIRNIRRDTLKDLRDLEKEKLISEDELKTAEEKLQELTEKMIEQVGEIGNRKEHEIMEF